MRFAIVENQTGGGITETESFVVEGESLKMKEDKEEDSVEGGLPDYTDSK